MSDVNARGGVSRITLLLVKISPPYLAYAWHAAGRSLLEKLATVHTTALLGALSTAVSGVILYALVPKWGFPPRRRHSASLSMRAVIGRALVYFWLMLMTKVLSGTRTDASIERQSKGAE